MAASAWPFCLAMPGAGTGLPTAAASDAGSRADFFLLLGVAEEDFFREDCGAGDAALRVAGAGDVDGRLFVGLLAGLFFGGIPIGSVNPGQPVSQSVFWLYRVSQ